MESTVLVSTIRFSSSLELEAKLRKQIMFSNIMILQVQIMLKQRQADPRMLVPASFSMIAVVFLVWIVS